MQERRPRREDRAAAEERVDAVVEAVLLRTGVTSAQLVQLAGEVRSERCIVRLGCLEGLVDQPAQRAGNARARWDRL
jgi:hypothetical protein